MNEIVEPGTWEKVVAANPQHAHNYAERFRQMEANGYITAAERAQASAQPLIAVPNRGTPRPRDSDYFVEDVRRSLIAKFGETEKDGRNSVYGGGLWIRTSEDPRLQTAAETAMRNGFMRYERGRAWRGPGTVRPSCARGQGQYA